MFNSSLKCQLKYIDNNTNYIKIESEWTFLKIKLAVTYHICFSYFNEIIPNNSTSYNLLLTIHACLHVKNKCNVF